MLVQLRKGQVVLRPTDDADTVLADWFEAHAGKVFRLTAKDGAAMLHTLGSEAEARNESLNITSRAPGDLQLISNFAHTPFELGDVTYAGIEGFWQGLKFPDAANRRRLAELYRSAARDAGYDAPASEELHYDGKRIRAEHGITGNS